MSATSGDACAARARTGGTPQLNLSAIMPSCLVSRKTMETDIGNIAFRHCVIFACDAEAEPGKAGVGHRRLPSGPGRDVVNAKLEEIVEEAAGGL